jgi:hypothetical protein
VDLPSARRVELTERDAHKLPVGLHDVWIKCHAENPGEQAVWRTDLYERVWSPASRRVADGELSSEDAEHLEIMRRVCVAIADRHLKQYGISMSRLGHERFQRAVAAAFQRSSLRLERMSLGKFDEAAEEDRLTVRAGSATRRAEPVSLEKLLSGWERERQPIISPSSCNASALSAFSSLAALSV